MAKGNTTKKKSAAKGASKPAKKSAAPSKTTAKKSAAKAGAAAKKSAAPSKTTAKKSAAKSVKKSAAKSAGKTAKKSAAKGTAKKSGSGRGTGKAGSAVADASKTIKKSAAKGAKASERKAAGTPKPTTTAPAKTAAKGGGKPVAKPEAKAAAKTNAPVAKGEPKPAAESTPEAAKPAGPATDGKPQRKGITIVSKKPTKKPAAKRGSDIKIPTIGGGLLGPGTKRRKPLIASGPGAASARDGLAEADPNKKRKSPFNKKQLEKYRDILRLKRAQLLGDVSSFEFGALQSGGGGLSHIPQHIAEQGSDVQDQSLMLDLAAADRGLIREIDAALQRIEDGIYGLCEVTGEPIGEDRLEELPWARFSIEAARMRERGALR